MPQERSPGEAAARTVSDGSDDHSRIQLEPGADADGEIDSPSAIRMIRPCRSAKCSGATRGKLPAQLPDLAMLLAFALVADAEALHEHRWLPRP